MYYVVSYEGRCMGFCPSEQKAQDIVEVLGPPASYELVSAPFPTDEEHASREWEQRQPKVETNVVSIVAESEENELALSEEEIGELNEVLESADVLSDSAMSDDPWADEPTRTFITGAPGESGYAKKVG